MISCEVVEKIQIMLRISNKLTDEERHYLNNLIVSGMGQLPDEDGKIPSTATHRLLQDKGMIVGAEKVIRKPIDKGKKV